MLWTSRSARCDPNLSGGEKWDRYIKLMGGETSMLPRNGKADFACISYKLNALKSRSFPNSNCNGERSKFLETSNCRRFLEMGVNKRISHSLKDRQDCPVLFDAIFSSNDESSQETTVYL